jgi:hypothetical protein
MCKNESTRIYAWKYTGGFQGILKAFIKNSKNNYVSGTIGNLANVYPFLGDWECTDKIIQTDFSNRPAMTAEVYPNENKARIILTGPHPEYNVWWGGHIQEAEDTENNNLWDGLHRWYNVTPNSEDLEWKYNYWINRRSVAWVSQLVPDNDLPPVYGPSQVSDIYPYNQSSEFTVIGNAETADGIESLDLYYRYSTDNSSWSDWKLYVTDTDGSDGWLWEFNATNGTGYYQFYSIRHVEYEGHTETETVPPGPDAIARVVD